MAILIVVTKRQDWPLEIPGVDIVDAWDYVTQPEYSQLRGAKVFNLCRSYRYQSTGYYVSLLAEARGHKPLPSVTTLQDLKGQRVVRTMSDELESLVQRSLAPLQSNQFTLSVYFGRNIAKRYERLSLHLFNLYQSPLLRFRFVRQEDDKWQLKGVRTISASDVPDAHRPFLAEAARRHFSGRGTSVSKRPTTRFDVAMLYDPKEQENCPSNGKALEKFAKVGASMGLGVELITRDDFGRLAEFDALFLRETTFVNHHSYRFARRAESEGLVVIDDPRSIVRCTNKVFLAELLGRHHIPTPETRVVHKDNAGLIEEQLGFPCVLKKPDSSFSSGVVKVKDADELQARLADFFDESELVVAQQFLPTTFDWRITCIDGKPLFACKYYMAPGHWQIIRQEAHDRNRYGKVETLPVELAPRRATAIALKAANLIGDGFYGVDVKQSDRRFYVMEVNDNPNVDAGVEDQILRDELYERIMSVFLRRIEERKSRSFG